MSRIQTLVHEAEILRRHGNLPEAARRCRKALKLEPGNVGLAAMLGMLLGALEDWGGATPLLSRVAVERPRDADAQFNLAVALQRQARHAEAVERLRAALALQGERADAFTALGFSLQELGREAEACKQYERSLALSP